MIDKLPVLWKKKMLTAISYHDYNFYIIINDEARVYLFNKIIGKILDRGTTSILRNIGTAGK